MDTTTALGTQRRIWATAAASKLCTSVNSLQPASSTPTMVHSGERQLPGDENGNASSKFWRMWSIHTQVCHLYKFSGVLTNLHTYVHLIAFYCTTQPSLAVVCAMYWMLIIFLFSWCQTGVRDPLMLLISQTLNLNFFLNASPLCVFQMVFQCTFVDF